MPDIVTRCCDCGVGTNVLGEWYDDAARLELVFVVGHYTMLSMVANTAGVPPEPTWEPLPPV